MYAANRNIFWAKTFVDALAHSGLRAVCIAPGSRSTPLVIAFADHPQITVYSHIDERSAAFFALGLALTTDRPVGIICSSGTATANFHPAVIEARYANVPLLVLTADRPHEMRDSGANQTVDQVKMFGTHVLWAVDVALPEAAPPPVALRNLRTLAARACAKATGVIGGEKGPVHLNFPFRKPLEPTPVEGEQVELADAAVVTRITRGTLTPSLAQVADLAGVIAGCARGLIVAGPRTEDAEAVKRFAALTGWPLLADPLANVQGAGVLSGYDTFISAARDRLADPEVIVHFGAMPASAALERYLTGVGAQRRILISANGVWTDPYHQLSDLLHVDAGALCDALTAHLPGAPAHDAAWAAGWRALEAAAWQAVTPALGEQVFDGAAVWATVESLKALYRPVCIMTASSLPVRHLEQYTRLDDMAALRMFASRGASGIDGTVSTALGVAASDPATPTVLITGDLAFYHDMNGLLAVKRCGVQNIVIVLVNNDGGGIFQRLPIRDFDPPFTDLFLTPHGLDFEPAVRMYGLAYQRVSTLADLQAQIQQAVTACVPMVIEVRTDYREDAARREAIQQQAQARLQSVVLD